ncbi:MAG: hypothetical protein HY863_16535 [Chloroflexi bacterium]|nr:hypothetical protein [Chloroflexota bacterium]
MFRWQRIHLVLAVYGLLVSIGAFITALAIGVIPSDPGNGVFLGFSLQRLVLIIIPLMAGITAAVFAITTYRNKVYAEQVWQALFGNEGIARGVRWGSIVIFTIGWIASFTPLYRFWDYKDYFVRISPIVIWLTFVCALTIAVSWVEKYGFDWPRLSNVLRSQKSLLNATLISLTVFALTWILIAATGLGVRVSEDYWYATGVPILVLQVLLAFATGLGVLFLERSSHNFPIRLDTALFILIWAVAAFLWVREPLQSSYFAPGPYPPDFEYHPYSDASVFDIASQFALIGQGINNGVFFDRALYMGFLVFLHTLAGQNYSQVVALQAAIYAVFPAILYLLGKAIHSRAFGVTLALLTMLRGINSIAASNMIDLASPKQMLTDFPIAIFAAWFALMAVKWLKAPNKNYHYALWAGGAAGLAIMLRTHALFLLLFAILLAIIIYRHQKLRGLVVSTLLVIAMTASIFPWGTRSGGSVFDVYMQRIRVVIQARYYSFPPAAPSAATPQSNVPTPGIPVAPTQGVIIPNPENPPTSNNTERNTQPKNLPVAAISHFLHNVTTSIFILPTSPISHDLRHILKESTPFWKQYWNGSLDVGAALFISLDLLMIALGIGIAWKFAKLAGLVPLGIFIAYNLANALARTSGGRYIVPADWVVIFYFALGLLQIILWGLTLFKLEANSDEQKIIHDKEFRTPWTWEPLKKIPWIILLFLFIGSSLPLSETLFPKRYPAQTQAELLTLLDEKGYLQEMGFDKPTIQTFSDQWGDFSILNGRAIYPRLLMENKGEPKNIYPYLVLAYPRMGFTLIGPQGTNYVILPEDKLKGKSLYFPNASDVIVLGCRQGQNFDALAVVVINEKTMVYVRQPVSPLQCPLQTPVCNENHVCR